MSVIVVNRNQTYGVQVSLSVHECPSCGVVYGIPTEFRDRCYAQGERYYCPNGHSLGWSETEADRQRAKAETLARRLSAESDRANRWQVNADRERRSAIAYKGHLTRVRNRIVNGICPVPGCKRSGFQQVMRHIASEHPDWLHDHPEVTSGDAGAHGDTHAEVGPK